ncbi:MAG: 4Fe-4S dicluster domain-containing protein [Spirochaetes bacterium]|nr:4Fe-4S dicluster domain-containing protein [Spirochaetota bacterium]
MYLIKKSSVLDIARELQKEYRVYGPVVEKETRQTMFTGVEDAAELDLNAPIPAMPPKHIVFPHFERIMSYTYDRAAKKADIRPDFDDSRKALFGIRSCDLTGIICLDRFFLGQEFVDEVYRNHRKNMFIVANTCTVPFKQCFCVCTDSGPSAREGFDLNLTDLGDQYLVEAGSEKGKKLAEKMGLAKADDSLAKRKEAIIDASVSKFDAIATDNKAWISRVVNRVTTGLIDEKVWEYIGNQCIECGACSYVCPSCSCFNIVDPQTSEEAADRMRTWDSCSYEGYSRMAGGHNPRKPVEDRRSKRFFCKLSYSQSKKYLRPGCVGCGRCQWVCPGDIGLPNVVTYIRRDIQQ